jgi:hypothetical protein
MSRTGRKLPEHSRLQTLKGEKNMRFLSIYMCPERNTPPTPEEMARMGKLIEDSMKSGQLIATEGCMPSALGARVRVDNGNYTVSDGPFTEAKEVVGGLAILEAPSKEAAIGYVKGFLAVVGQGECELRQIYETPGAQPAVAETAELVARTA